MAGNLRITGEKKIAIDVGGELKLIYWNDDSMTAFYTQPGGNTVYLTYSDLKLLKAELVNMKGVAK